MLLSPHFDQAEFERDSPITDPAVAECYRRLCVLILEPLRTEFNEPFYITSGYRNAEVNARIGGAKDSQHVADAHDCAVDGYFESYRKNMQAVFDWLRMKSGLPFDQLILEHGRNGDIIHVSIAAVPRREALEGATYNQSAYTSHYVASA